MADRELDPEKVTDEDIHHIIDGLCQDGICHNCAEWIKQLAHRAKPIAISRLKEGPLLEEVESSSFPLKELIPAVTGWDAPAVLTRLRELAQDERPHLRQLAGEVLAGAGLDEDAGLLVRLLRDDDVRVRDSVLFGLTLYYTNRYKDREYSQAVIDALYPELRATIGKNNFMLEQPAAAMFRLDRQRAAEDLADPKLWAHDAPEGMEVVNAFGAAKMAPPLDALEARVRGFADISSGETGTYHFARSLKLLAEHDLDRAVPFLETASSHPDNSVRRVARECQCRVAGILRPYDKVFELSRDNDQASMDSHQTVIASVCGIDGEVGNGGFEQYLWNSTADQWPKHRDALKEVNADEHTAILDRVTQLFGQDGPPTDREQRHKPLAKIARKHENTLDEANSQWYGLDEKLEQLVIEYALQHPDSFRP